MNICPKKQKYFVNHDIVQYSEVFTLQEIPSEYFA